MWHTSHLSVALSWMISSLSISEYTSFSPSSCALGPEWHPMQPTLPAAAFGDKTRRKKTGSIQEAKVALLLMGQLKIFPYFVFLLKLRKRCFIGKQRRNRLCKFEGVASNIVGGDGKIQIPYIKVLVDRVLKFLRDVIALSLESLQGIAVPVRNRKLPGLDGLFRIVVESENDRLSHYIHSHVYDGRIVFDPHNLRRYRFIPCRVFHHKVECVFPVFNEPPVIAFPSPYQSFSDALVTSVAPYLFAMTVYYLDLPLLYLVNA